MIMVVDDHADTCHMLGRLLETYGLEAICFTNPREALSAIGSTHPSCVILDDNMPDLTGVDLLRILRTELKLTELPVIVYSAAHELQRQEEAKRLGATAWITKGTPFDTLLRKISEAEISAERESEDDDPHV